MPGLHILILFTAMGELIDNQRTYPVTLWAGWLATSKMANDGDWTRPLPYARSELGVPYTERPELSPHDIIQSVPRR